MKRISTEARLLDWIDTAPIEVVVSIMSIAQARVKARVRKEQPSPVAKARKAKVITASSGTTTVFPAGEVRSA
jgi:hypothetical protein